MKSGKSEEWYSKYKWAFRNMVLGYAIAAFIIFTMVAAPQSPDIPQGFVLWVHALQGMMVGLMVLHGYLASIAYYSMKESMKDEDHEDVQP